MNYINIEIEGSESILDLSKFLRIFKSMDCTHKPTIVFEGYKYAYIKIFTTENERDDFFESIQNKLIPPFYVPTVDTLDYSL
jgi:hypothetical protein